MKYIKESFSKFKKDVLSRVFYDIMKYFFLTVILAAILKYTPLINEKLELEVSLTIWSIIMMSLILIGVSFTFSFLLFNNKFKSIRAKSRMDELTGLKNHKALESDLDNFEKSRDNKEEPVSIILLDIDDFKKFNDDNSYEIADRILTKLGGLLEKDSRITDETYRYFMRGDEFLIIAKQTSLSNAQMAAERKRKLIANSSFEVGGSNFKVTVSCGVTEFNKGESKTDVLDRVGKALQNAKKKENKNCTEILV